MSFVRTLNLFPSCIQEGGDTGIGTQNPIGESLERVMGWYWRVKSWDMSFSWISNDFGSNSWSQENVPGVWWDTPIEITDELDLIGCGDLSSRYRQFPFIVGCSAWAWLKAFGPADTFIRKDGVIWPQMSGFFMGYSGVGTGNSGITMCLQPGTDLIQSNEAVLNFDGMEYRGFYLTENLQRAVVTINPRKYWRYDPGDGGGPVYDEDTGEQLRSYPLL